MKPGIINGQFITKSNFDFGDEIITSPNFRLKHIEEFKVEAEAKGDGEISIKAIIPADGKLVIKRAEEKNPATLISVDVSKGFFMTTIPVSLHDETQSLDCILTSNGITHQIKVELVQEEIQL